LSCLDGQLVARLRHASHAGRFFAGTAGRALVRQRLAPWWQEVSRMLWPAGRAARRFGNTSSSSIWYVLANIESCKGVRRGDRVWQIAFGSGFKCNSAVWRALRNVREEHAAWR